MSWLMDNGFVIKDTLEVTDRKAFLSYLRKNKIKKEKFIISTFNKCDLLTGEPLLFKNEDQYFINDFNSRENLIEYLTKYPDKAYDYCIKFFNERKKRKSLVWSPSEVELKTFIAPSISLLKKIEVDWNSVVNQVNLKSKFIYDHKKIHQESGELTIIQDTREQKAIKFNCDQKISKLDFGDYTALGDFYSNIYVERKSLSDFLGTLSQGFDRFIKEIQRAQNLGGYLFIVIESSLGKSLKFNELGYIFSKVTPDFIFHNMRSIMEEYPFVQFLFVSNREESARVIEKIFRAKEDIKTFDLQYEYNRGNL